MKYRVKCHELVWMNSIYEIEADSPDDIEDIILSGEADEVYSDYDCIDQCDIETITLIDE